MLYRQLIILCKGYFSAVDNLWRNLWLNEGLALSDQKYVTVHFGRVSLNQNLRKGPPPISGKLSEWTSRIWFYFLDLIGWEDDVIFVDQS